MLTDAAALRCAMLNMKNELAGFAEDQVYSPEVNSQNWS